MEPDSVFFSRKRVQTSELPFFFFVSLVLVLIAAWSIFSSPELRTPIRLIPFLVLMVVHNGLYWLALGISEHHPYALVYLAAQGLIALALNLLGGNIALSYGLYFGLIGLAVGMYKLSRTGILFIIGFILLAIFSYFRIVSGAESALVMLGLIPALIFVVIYVMLYNRQAEARARAQSLADDLEAANRQLSEYADQVEALTLTNERQRMARDLHDTLSQGLAGLILQLEAASAHLSLNRPERARTILQQTMIQARTTLADSRRAIDNLRQVPADLKEAIQQEAQRFTQTTGIPCSTNIDLTGPYPPALNEPALHAVTEALINIARHAQASQVLVNVTTNALNGLEIWIEDNGVGFDPHSAVGQPGHYGLLGIRERARMAGGEFGVESSPGKGAKLFLRLPYHSSTSDKTGHLESQV